MIRQKVSDPALLAQLGESPRKKVTDPNLLAQLNEENEDIGSYVDNLPAPEGFFKKLPRNILAGLAGLGHKTMNTPHDFIQALENSSQNFGNGINLFGEKTNNIKTHPFSQFIPYQEEQNFPEMLGQQGTGTLMDNIIQKGIEYAPELAGGRAILRAGMRKYPISQKGAARQLKEAQKLINQSKYSPKVSIDQDLINESLGFLPKTRASHEMLAGAEMGEYEPAFSLQSQIGKHERDLRKSPLASERLLAPQARELKQQILNSMQESLIKSGYGDAAKLLKGGIDDYRKYIKFRDTVYPILKKIGFPLTGAAVTALGYKKGKKIASKLID